MSPTPLMHAVGRETDSSAIYDEASGRVDLWQCSLNMHVHSALLLHRTEFKIQVKAQAAESHSVYYYHIS